MSLNQPFVFSQSSLHAYTQCPLQFYLRYVQRQPWPAPERSPVQLHEKRRQAGLRFHRLAQQAALGIPLDLLTRQAAAEGETMLRWWQAFLDAFRPLLTRRGALPRLYPEWTLGAPLGTHRLLAKIDLLAQDDQTWTIYDWKTEEKAPRREYLRQRWQTRVYMALLAHHLREKAQPEQIRMVYWFAEYPDTPYQFEYTQGDFVRDWRDLEAITAEIAAAEDFPRCADEKPCAYCNYRSYCGRGIQAGSLDESFFDEDNQPDDLPDFDALEAIPF